MLIFICIYDYNITNGVNARNPDSSNHCFVFALLLIVLVYFVNFIYSQHTLILNTVYNYLAQPRSTLNFNFSITQGVMGLFIELKFIRQYYYFSQTFNCARKTRNFKYSA